MSSSELVSSLRRQNEDLRVNLEAEVDLREKVELQLQKVKQVKTALKEKLVDCRGRLEVMCKKYDEVVKEKEGKPNVLESLENKPRRSIMPVVQPKEDLENNGDCSQCQEVKTDMRLLKVEVRMAEKKKQEVESRLKFVREVMLQDQIEEKNKLEKEVKELEKKLAEREGEERRDEEMEVEMDKLKTRVEELTKENSDLEAIKFKREEERKELEEVKKELDNCKEELETLQTIKKNYASLKHTCLELQDQIAEYEKLLAKLETNVEELRKKNDDLKKELNGLRNSESQHKIASNELKSKLIFAEAQLKEVSEMRENVDKSKRELEEIWGEKFARLSALHEEGQCALQEVQEKYSQERLTVDRLQQELDMVRDDAIRLKEENCGYLNTVHSVKESKMKLHQVMEEMLQKIEAKNEENHELKARVRESKAELEKKEMESSTQLKQLKKLVDHLQSKVDTFEKKETKRGKKSSVEWTLSYEEIQEQLEEEKQKRKELESELIRYKSASKMVASPLKQATVREMTKKHPVSETTHEIPHRFQRQKNMKSQKCSVCYGNITFLHTASVCKFCNRIVHPSCEMNVGRDCGLTKDMALVLRTSSSSGPKFKGFLRVPAESTSCPGKSWKTVAVQILGNRLIVDDGSCCDINLKPDEGFVFIQSTVAYSELLHTSAFDQPHIFKIGYSSGSKIRETHYFMAKTFQEKAAWIEAIEKVTLDSNDDPKPSESRLRKRSTSPMKSLVHFNVLATFSTPEMNLFCSMFLPDVFSRFFIGSSSGLYFRDVESEASQEMQHMKRGPESVFQMEYIKEYKEVVMIINSERKLVVVKESDLVKCLSLEDDGLPQQFRYRNIEVVSSCHLFQVGIHDDQVHLCVVDDCRVSLLVRSDLTGEYQLRYAFSTDKPTTCLRFTPTSVLVATDKVYEIQLENFEVEEFIVDPTLFVNNQLVDLFAVSNDEFLLCFQDYGLFVDRNGQKCRSDLKWTGLSGQFFISEDKRRVWLAYHNAIEAIDLEKRSQSDLIECKNPQLLNCCNARDVVYVDKKANLLIVRGFNDKIK